MFRPQTRQAFQTLLGLGLTDALRAVSDAAGEYTFWDYQAGAWQKNNGLRIDHLLLSPQASDRLSGVGIDRHVRGWEKASDHVPVWIDLDLEPQPDVPERELASLEHDSWFYEISELYGGCA